MLLTKEKQEVEYGDNAYSLNTWEAEKRETGVARQFVLHTECWASLRYTSKPFPQNEKGIQIEWKFKSSEAYF